MKLRLTSSQKRAIETDSAETLIIAGAGSGKTTVLVGRIAYLLSKGCSASDMLVLTFTRKAAREMIERVGNLIRYHGGDPDKEIKGMLIGTFHSVAFGMIRANLELLGYRSEITVIDEDDANLLLEQISRDLGYLIGKKWKYHLSMKALRRWREKFYATGKGSMIDPDGHRASYLHTIFNEYLARLRHMNCLDFGMILLECSRLLRENRGVLESLQKRIKHVLVDELQDEDEVQFNLHHFFAPPASFFGVGDRRQSIYGFRGARPDLMTELHPNAEIIDLCECFRCGDRIVDSANKLIRYNDDPLTKDMIGATGNAGHCKTRSGRSADIACSVTALHGLFENLPYQDIAVLARNHRTLRRLADVFEEHGIPFHRVGAGFDVCETDEFKMILAAMRLCLNPNDDMAFMRLMPALGISPANWIEIRRDAAKYGRSLWNIFSSPTYGPSTRYIPRIARYISRVEPVEDDVIEVIQGLVSHMEDFVDPVRNLQVRHFWKENCDSMSVAKALRWYALRDSQDDHLAGDHVTLCTIHAAKGLEWPCVILVGLNEGDLPSSQAIRSNDPEAVREERRVCYVAITRAKHVLVLHYRRPEDQDPERKTKLTSRFLPEAGLHLPPGEFPENTARPGGPPLVQSQGDSNGNANRKSV